MAIWVLPFILLIASCGKQKFPDYSAENDQAKFVGEYGTFKGRLKPINQSGIKGTYDIRVLGDQIQTKIFVTQFQKDIRIQQYIHSHSKCPGDYSDLDSNSEIDFDEINISSGAPLFLLDSKIGDYDEGSDVFPVTDEEGSYNYAMYGSIISLKEDLFERGLLLERELLSLHERTLVLYGSKRGPLDPIACVEL